MAAASILAAGTCRVAWKANGCFWPEAAISPQLGDKLIAADAVDFEASAFAL
jgi:hypothetical protein